MIAGFFEPFTLFFIIIIVGVILFFRKKKTANAIANMATSIGILGTFFGVTMSLVDFDVNDVAGSVPQLLEGLKIAFFTSIAGLVASLIVKSFPNSFGQYIEYPEEDERKSMISQMILALREINSSISGDKEASLATQISHLRDSNIQHMEQIDTSLREFGEKMVADSTQSLIDALTQVMQDFNTKINEQLGDNFRKFNESLGVMLAWQKEYAHQVEQMTDQFNRSLSTIQQCEAVLKDITEQSKVYHDSAEKLDALLDNLNVNLVGLNEMAENVKEAFPMIDQKIEDLTTGFANSVESAVRENNRMMQTQREAIDSQINTFQQSYEDIGQQQHKLISDLTGRVDKLMIENSERIKEQMTALDEELGEELNKALESLGKQLTALSNRFVEDYTPLTVKLKEILQLSNRLS